MIFKLRIGIEIYFILCEDTGVYGAIKADEHTKIWVGGELAMNKLVKLVHRLQRARQPHQSSSKAMLHWKKR